MTNTEKIIKALERAKAQSEEYAQDHIIVPFKELDMILVLLKAQETTPYKWTLLEHDYTLCSSCDVILQRYYKYCPGCGRRIKWDAAG